MAQLADKAAIVTGGSKGIGKAIASAFLDEGRRGAHRRAQRNGPSGNDRRAGGGGRPSRVDPDGCLPRGRW